MEELCEEMRRLGLDYCTPIFEKEGVDGSELAEASKSDFVHILTNNGGATHGHNSSHVPIHPTSFAGVCLPIYPTPFPHRSVRSQRQKSLDRLAAVAQPGALTTLFLSHLMYYIINESNLMITLYAKKIFR